MSETKIPPLFSRSTLAGWAAEAREAGRYNAAAALDVAHGVWSASSDEATRKELYLTASAVAFNVPDLSLEELGTWLEDAAALLKREAAALAKVAA